MIDMLERVRNFFLPVTGEIPLHEKLYSGLAGLVGISLVAWISEITSGQQGLIFMAASMGSAAVLLFAAPHSPMAQPWPLLGGHLVSALVGVFSYQSFGAGPMAAAIAVAIAILAMFFLRCMNPPGGAAALGAVMGGPEIHGLGYYYVLMPVALNVFVILLIALIINNVIPNRRYPLMQELHPQKRRDDFSWALGQSLIEIEDIDAAMDEHESFIDADRDELRQIYQRATMNAYKRRLGHVSCGDIMLNEPTRLTANMALAPVRRLMESQRRSALPVIDDERHVIGMINLADIQQDYHHGARIADVMKKPDDVALVDQHVLDIVPLISKQGWQAISVVDDQHRLLGLITRSEIARALLSLR
jgi:CBS domain-containing membrane protein